MRLKEAEEEPLTKKPRNKKDKEILVKEESFEENPARKKQPAGKNISNKRNVKLLFEEDFLDDEKEDSKKVSNLKNIDKNVKRGSPKKRKTRN